MQISHAQRLKAQEKGNSQLKPPVAEMELDIQILKETLALEAKNF